MSELFSVLSSVTMISVIFIYFGQVIGGVSTPNPATWITWFVVMAINTVTYYFVSQGSIWQILTPFVITCGILIILVFSLVKGKFGRIGTIDVIILSLSVVVGIFWKITRDPIASNLLMQVILVVSFVPTVVGLLKGRLREKSLSWNLAVLSYGFLIASIVSSSEWNWTQLAYPFLNGIVGNGSVAITAILTKKGGNKMSNTVFDFADDPDVRLKVQETLKGAKSKTEVRSRLHGCIVQPDGELHSVQGHGDGFDVLFLIGAGKRPRAVHCVETDFDDFS